MLDGTEPPDPLVTDPSGTLRPPAVTLPQNSKAPMTPRWNGCTHIS
jgi:hypothetical protein